MRNKFSQYPLYIPSKGRSQYMDTSRALSRMGARHYIVVEPQEVELYQRSVVENNLLATILPLDMNYKLTYELCDDLGQTRSTGPGPARNFAWDHSISLGYDWHWVMDDNIVDFLRLHKNTRISLRSDKFFWYMEEFTGRYTNVVMAGPQYRFFVRPRMQLPPVITNTRIYSCNLIKNDIPFRWRGRYNEDTILSLDILKAGLCTMEFYAFLQDKLTTQTRAGGNTQEFYHAEGQLEPGARYASGGTTSKSQMLVDVHPDVSKLAWKFGRVHHTVNYHGFKSNYPKIRPLARKPVGNYSDQQLYVDGHHCQYEWNNLDEFRQLESKMNLPNT